MTLTPELKERLKGLNELMNDISDSANIISDVLRISGLSDSQIEEIREKRLEEFIDLVTHGLRCATIRYQRGSILSDLRELYYGYGRQPRYTLQELAEQLGISRERVNQLKRKSLRPLLNRHRSSPFEEILIASARQLLGIHVQKLEKGLHVFGDDSKGSGNEGGVRF